MSNPSPPKPWERAGAGATSSQVLPSSAATSTAAAASSTISPPALPNRPSTLSSVVNQNASNYAYGGSPFGASPYGAGYTGGYGGYNSYSPYNRFGSSYGGSMYGGGGYGYGGGMGGGMFGAGGMPGMYGAGMGMDPNNPSLTQSFSQSTQATFQLIESIVGAFGGLAQMLESTYMATHSSFFTMVQVAEQFGNLRNTLGSVLGIFTLLRWIRTAIAKLTGRPLPASSRDLTPAKFAAFTGHLPDGSPAPAAPSKKPLAVFLLAVFGLPYLMGKLIKALARSQDEEARRRQLVEGSNEMDPNKLEFYRVLYDYTPETQQSAGAVTGLDLSVKKGDFVAVLSKADPLGNPSDWWRCRTRDTRVGYLPAPYLEVVQRRGVAGQIANAEHVSPPGSRAQTLTTNGASSRAATLTGMKVEDLVGASGQKPQGPPQIEGKPADISVESFQKGLFNS